MIVDQSVYVKALLRKYGMENCKPSNTSGIDKQKLSKSMCPEIVGNDEYNEAQKFDYRGVIGSVMHLCVSTKPDLSYILSIFILLVSFWIIRVQSMSGLPNTF